MIVVKDIFVTPETLSNNGESAIEVRCTVFSRNENCVVTDVGLDLRHTMLDDVFPLRPDPDNLLTPSAEGVYTGRLELPRLMDAGAYRLPIVARDSKEGAGAGVSRFDVQWNPGTPPEIGTPGFAEMQEAYGGHPFVGNNRVEVLDNGQKALDKRLAMIEGARRQINIQTYTFEGMGMGGRLMDALLKKVDLGLEVNVILNSDSQFPSSPLSLLRLKANQLFYEWTRTGIEKQDEDKKPESFWDRILPRKKAGGLNLALFSGRSVGVPQSPAFKALVMDHWLSRMMDEKKIKPDGPQDEHLASYSGPGGLPALPLLDYAVHEKIMVVDGEKAIVGGRNLESAYFEHWQDLDLYAEGPVVDQIQAGFLKNFSEIADPDTPRLPTAIYHSIPAEPGVTAQFVQSRPWSGANNVLLTMCNAIAACRSTFYAMSQYLVLPGSMLRDAILEAAGRGVDVRILTNSVRTCKEVGFSTAYFVTLNYLEELLGAGVRIFEVLGNEDDKAPQPYLHNKEFVFDGRLAAVGSFNLSMRSSHIESENLLFVCDQAFAQARKEAFLRMVESQAREITKKRFQRMHEQHKTRIEMSRHLELLF
ncbi:MAG: phosphatidylserine/phosphatidylglycerophosphate/cardiolipin synthase family protein [Desulfatibacillum sp.]|nr:phosphatidylserine/phosphatidylglycerophosphate/cardiolipin synthase family protein [Desulfatibacillum sp.]